MRASQAAAAAFGLVAFPHHAVAVSPQQAHRLAKRWERPIINYDLNTISTCTWWYDNVEGRSCKVVRDWMYVISPEDFSRWNPSITLDCGNWRELSYCVGVESEKKPITTSSTVSTTSTTSTTSAATPSATRKPELLGWEPLGCYVDYKTLHNHTTKAGGDDLTVAKCEEVCFADNFLFAGVKDGNDCWCGEYVGNGWTESQEDCNIPCPGDSAQVCGGDDVFNIFKAKTKNTLPPPWTEPADISSSSSSSSTTTTTNTPTTTTTKTTTTTRGSEATATPTWQAVGCYKDMYPASNRTLEASAGFGNTMTVASCQMACAQAGYQYAGLEYGMQCWCGDAIQSPDENAPVAEAECDMPCTGDAAQLCGSTARIYLYRYVVPTVPWVALGCYAQEDPRILRNKADVRGGNGSNNTR